MRAEGPFVVGPGPPEALRSIRFKLSAINNAVHLP